MKAVAVLAILASAIPAVAGVSVQAPINNSHVATSVQYVATATTSCSKGVSSMGVYSAPNVLAYTVNGSSLNTELNLNPGTYYTTVQEWDNCGGSSAVAITITVSGGASQVQVVTPANNAKVGTQVQYVATASSSCSNGVAAMGIYTDPGVLAYKVGGASLNKVITLNPGNYNTTVQEWDNCGGSASTPVAIQVGSGGSSNQFVNLHQKSGWTGYGLLPPTYGICGSCSPSGSRIAWGMKQGITTPTLSGNSSRMNIAGSTVYSDGLWNNHLIGDFSSQGLPDFNHTLAPSLHNFTYDVYFFTQNAGVSQALEFDINQFVGGKSFIWGHECRIAGGHEWDIWDNQGQHWHATGVPCNPVSNAWNHLVIQVQRTSANHLLFKSITLNGKTATLNYDEGPTSTSWYGITINYQQDGNYKQTPYSVWLDRLNFSYW